MARGFESKSVADQQEEALNPRPLGAKNADPRRRSLELARSDVKRRLEAAPAGPLRDTLQRALEDLDRRLAEPEPGEDAAGPQE
jgi:hypothetical protein